MGGLAVRNLGKKVSNKISMYEDVHISYISQSQHYYFPELTTQNTRDTNDLPEKNTLVLGQK